MSNHAQRLRTQANALLSQRGFGIADVSRIIQDCAREAQRVRDDAARLNGFLGQLGDIVFEHENRAIAELGGEPHTRPAQPGGLAGLALGGLTLNPWAIRPLGPGGNPANWPHGKWAALMGGAFGPGGMGVLKAGTNTRSSSGSPPKWLEYGSKFLEKWSGAAGETFGSGVFGGAGIAISALANWRSAMSRHGSAGRAGLEVGVGAAQNWGVGAGLKRLFTGGKKATGGGLKAAGQAVWAAGKAGGFKGGLAAVGKGVFSAAFIKPIAVAGAVVIGGMAINAGLNWVTRRLTGDSSATFVGTVADGLASGARAVGNAARNVVGRIRVPWRR